MRADGVVNESMAATVGYATVRTTTHERAET
jgi:hypothetical protein